MNGRHRSNPCAACRDDDHVLGAGQAETLTIPGKDPVRLVRRTCACEHCPCTAGQTTVVLTVEPPTTAMPVVTDQGG